MNFLMFPEISAVSKGCRRQNETPTLQSGLNLFTLQLLFLAAALHLLHNNLQGKLPNTIIQRLYSAQAWGEITFTLTYLLQLRLFWELPYQLRIHFVLGSVPFEESETSLCVRNVLFPREQRILDWISHLQECLALVESLDCKHFSTYLIPRSLHLSLLEGAD